LRDPEKLKAKRRKYARSDAKKACDKRYAQTEKGRATQKRARMKSLAKYRGTEKYKRTSTSYQLKAKFGITLEIYDVILTDQDGGCAICGKTPKEEGRRLHVDHDHQTGMIRGLLCVRCNQGLGCFKDNIMNLRTAIGYLQKEDYESSITEHEER